MNGQQPEYKHDCDKCIYLGTIRYSGEFTHASDHIQIVDTIDSTDGPYDLYFCQQRENWPTVIARCGNDGPDYKSGLYAVPHDRELQLAYKISQEKGLL